MIIETASAEDIQKNCCVSIKKTCIINEKCHLMDIAFSDCVRDRDA